MTPSPAVWGIDGDIIAYAVGFASNDDPVEEALLSTRSTIQAVMDGCECEYAQVYLSGKTNYRHEFSDSYKANRSGTAKPVHFEAIRQCMIEEMDAIVSDGEEADDLLGIAAVQKGWGIASLDKDLKGVPGWHYIWKGKDAGSFFVTEEEADRFFYTQLITGDSTDNIQGLFNRTGKKAMPKVKDPLEAMTTPDEMYSYVYQVYADAVKEAKMSSDEDDIKRWLLDQGRLLWIRRDEGQIWSPPDGT